MRRIFNLIIVLGLTSCTHGSQRKHEQRYQLDGKIILFNIGSASRVEIGRGINIISKCNPKVIALHAIFKGDSTLQDTLLINAITRAGNVVLSSVIRNMKLVNSDQRFVRASRSQGLASYGAMDNIVTQYQTFTPWNQQVLWSFPTTIAAEYNIEIGEKLMTQTKGNKYYNINFYSNDVHFYILPLDSVLKVNCEELNGKIVLMGYLGPGSEDSYPIEIRGKTENAYGTVIIANILTDMLAGNFGDADE